MKDRVKVHNDKWPASLVRPEMLEAALHCQLLQLPCRALSAIVEGHLVDIQQVTVMSILCLGGSFGDLICMQHCQAGRQW